MKLILMIYSIYIHIYLNALADLIKKGVNNINNSFSKANNLILFDNDNYYKNNELQINEERILENIKTIQIKNNLPCDYKLIKTKSHSKKYWLLILKWKQAQEKTYVYINSIYELNKLYGWSKFIIIIPSIAIREGVYKSFNITSEHFYEKYKSNVNSLFITQENLLELMILVLVMILM